ncbi:MAG TPA: PLP-dependent aspartate aminotransferase family protein [Candidatus Aminicenantes bacterium]|nr:PLP-dependent aspartate aminotransferase family protein [Candidatus Aminicenantes bacterium]HRY63775.1 PLP-dependent aspartate aminotransferase family protein [Candidatus Aminicenantes bacterium]HRZ70688.1 PLP-dependent aspartate aminotransferase family protein [Candidatus Aminicenantes bacterium]
MDQTRSRSPFTDVIHAGQAPDPATGAVSVPIYQSSTFAFASAEEGAARFAGKDGGYIYTRLGNPTTRALEDAVAILENGRGGLATASGMAAVTTVYTAVLEKDAHMIATAAVYGASRTVVENEYSRFGVRADFVDTSDIEAVRKRLTPRTRLLYVETPANPTLRLTDIRACAALAREHGLVLAVDNTFSSPILQNPLDLGADIVIHSLTKFINGHSDVVGGMILAREEALLKRLRKVLQLMGGTMDPHQAWLVLRGLKTLALRMDKAQDNAMRAARFLESHPKVRWVNYPGLPGHPQHELAKSQMKGFGTMLSFGLEGGFEAGRRMMNAVKLCALAVSLGSVESLIQHPASMTHAGVPRREREEAGITDDLVRLSVGCEGYEDIQADLAQALSA